MRRKAPLPLAQWLSSRNPSLRAKAETVLYHLGPDGGTVLFDAAEHELQSMQAFQGFWFLALFASLRLTSYLLNGDNDTIYLVCAAISLLLLLVFTSSVLKGRKRLGVLARNLAKRDDVRGVGPLIDVWRPTKVGGDAAIENELLRLLPRFMSQHTLDLRTDKKSTLRKKLRMLFSARASLFRRNDWTDERADFIVTACQLLARFGGERDKAVLRRIAESRARFPNQQFVREAAQMLLETPFVPPPAVPAAAPVISHAALNAAPPPPAISVRRQP